MPGVTSADVARASGVSRTTVSYVLNGKDDVAIPESTRRRVREAAARLGYSPSPAARALRTGRSDVVLCVLPDWPIGPVIDALLAGLAGELADRGLTLLVHHGTGRRPLGELWRALTPRAVVGFTAFTAPEQEAMRRAGIQVLGTVLDDDPQQPRLYSVSQTRVGRLQVQHLVSTGRRVLGYAAPTDPRVAEFAERRLAGVRMECADLGLPAPVVRPVALEVGSAVQAVRSWREADPAVTAVAAYNDDVALAVLAGLRAEGLAAPGDLAVIGVDDVPAARLAAPPLTTVSQAVEAQARYLGASVLAALDGGEAPSHPGDVLDVVVRESA